MPRSGRSLLVVTALSCGGVAALRPLYLLLDWAAALLGSLLGRSYARTSVLRGRDASVEALAAVLTDLARSPGVRSVDVFLNVHGRERSVTLAGGEETLESLAGALRAGGEPARKLRLLYSTTCHAAHHAPELRAAGFRMCLGARWINATGALETPLFLALGRGTSRGVPIRIADHPAARLPADALRSALSSGRWARRAGWAARRR